MTRVRAAVSSVVLRPSVFLACTLPTLLAACGASALDEEETRGRNLGTCDAGDCENNGAGGNDSTMPMVARPCPRTDSNAALNRRELNVYLGALPLPAPPAPSAPAALPPAGPIAPANPAAPGAVATSAPAPALVPEYCGDARVTAPETCDDLNAVAGDGCDALCQVEPGFVCPSPGSACTSVVVCGDGVVQGNEACDDGNTASGDGCFAECSIVESGYWCAPGQPCETLCGDYALAGAEACEDGNTESGDGCSATCRQEIGFECPLSAEPAVAQRLVAETIVFPNPMGTSVPPVAPVPACPGVSPDLTCIAAVCGNGVVEGGEACDDGNTLMGDQCTSRCALAPDCSAGPDACQTLCGDGLLLADGTEACDDGNLTPSDGCDAACAVEATHVCDVVEDVWDASLPPVYSASVGHSECHAVCGDGVIAGDEACDDGANNGLGYGYCTAQCTPGQRCGDSVVDADFGEECDSGLSYSIYVFDGVGCAPGCLIPPFCGDGITQAAFGEACDLGVDGNLGNSGGCDAACQAVAPCGDGVLQSFYGEVCDDGNRVSGDGCSELCQQENTPVVPPIATDSPFPIPPPVVPTPGSVDVPPDTPGETPEDPTSDPCR